MGKIVCRSCKKTVGMICPQCQANMTPVNKNVGTCPRCHYTGVGVCPTCRQPVQYSACFIATAAFGTPFTEELDILRDFRDSKLETNPIGKKITDFYYLTSPYVAKVIARSQKMRALVRNCLKPLINALRKK